MSMGYRIFVAERDTVTHISQKSFNEFYFRESGTLPKYADRTILVVLAMYELENRRPTRVVRMDTQRIRVTTDGSIDKEHLTEGLLLAASRISIGHESASSEMEGSGVIDATALFDARRWKQRHPGDPAGSGADHLLDEFFSSPMPKFKYTKIAGRRTLRLTPDRVPGLLRAMQKRSTWEGLIISPDAKLGADGEGQYPILSLGWYPNFGYEAHCIELTPKSHFLATGRKLSKPEVYVELGGQGQELWPRELFVPFETAEQAVLHLLRTGKRHPSLCWVAIDAFPRKNVGTAKRTVPA